MSRGNESVGSGATSVIEETERSRSERPVKRELDRDVMQMSSRELDRDVMQIEGALHSGEPDVWHLVERLRDGDPELTQVLAWLRDDGEAMKTTLSALVRLLESKPFLVEVLGRLARPERVFEKLLQAQRGFES